MLPGSIIYFTDDTHYIIVEGGISLDTQEKVDTYYKNRKQGVEDDIENVIPTRIKVVDIANNCVRLHT